MIDFSSLESIFNKATEPVQVHDQNVAGLSDPMNWLFVESVVCRQVYGTGQGAKILVNVRLATYESAVGSRLAYDMRSGTGEDKSVDGSLSVGVELMSYAQFDDTYVVHVFDGNLFAEIFAMVMGGDSLAVEGLAQTAPPAIDAFTNHVIERVRADSAH